MKTKLGLLLALAVLLNLNLQPSTIFAQGTAFSYQGQLQNNGSPVNGLYDVRFTVWDAPTNGNLIAGPLTNSATCVSNGLFTTTMDFGQSVFTGPGRWLELDVQTNGGSIFTTLLPFQPLLPMPYAIMANTASNLSGSLPAAQLSGTISNTSLPASPAFSGTVTANSFSGNAGGLTNLNASQLTSGTIPLAQLPAVVLTNNENKVVIGGTNTVASLTVPPTVPSTAIGSVSTGNNGPAPYSVAVAGRYAYVVNEDANTFQIYDVSNPSSPTNIGTSGTQLDPQSVVVAGRYAYVGNNSLSAKGLQIFDVSNPANPTSVGSGGNGSISYIAVSGHYVYAVYAPGSGLQIFDVSNPTNPVTLGVVATGFDPNCLAVAGRYAYVVSQYGGLQIFDVSNPNSPVNVGSVSAGGQPISVAVSGRYAYVANLNSLQIFDVSNPTNPASVGSFSSVSEPRSVAVAGRYAYVANYVGSLQIFDVSNPTNAISVASVSTGSGPISVAVSGRYAYVVNFNGNTLQIFDLGGAYIQQMEAGTIETGTLQTRDTVSVGNNLNVRGGLTVSASARISGGLSVDNGSITATNFAGGGAGLTGLSASQLSSGTVPLAQLSGITGNQLTAAAWQLATNLDGGNAALASNVVSGIAITNAFIINSVFAGNGGGLTNLNASQLSSGVISMAQLPGAVLTNNQTGVMLNGVFTGDGSGLTNLTANSITGGFSTNIIIDGHMFYITNGSIMDVQ